MTATAAEAVAAEAAMGAATARAAPPAEAAAEAVTQVGAAEAGGSVDKDPTTVLPEALRRGVEVPSRHRDDDRHRCGHRR